MCGFNVKRSTDIETFNKIRTGTLFQRGIGSVFSRSDVWIKLNVNYAQKITDPDCKARVDWCEVIQPVTLVGFDGHSETQADSQRADC